ncbi:hypothetical protein M8A51_03970 [Schlegelella sp. S2-27]|uniref:Right handed beta helix region n=1 Tax=Caldimonas mangrovi TaxID=2944811 RepID=A0ABT0YJ55_9BURK|nr:hypothetical protein [Caldimonas mangrovi]MCM5678688.1 hypothetical protein [Caldimonas mangrovi]
MKIFEAIALASTVLLMTACGGGSNKGDGTEQPSEPPGPPSSSCIPSPRVGPSHDALLPLSPETASAGGTWSGVEISGTISQLAPDRALALSDCIIRGSLVWVGRLTLERCIVEGSVAQETGWMPAWSTHPELARWTLRNTHIHGRGQTVGLRPNGRTLYDAASRRPLLVEDSIVEIGQTQPPAHSEAMQMLGGRDQTFRRVVFRNNGVFTNAQTAVIFSKASEVRFEDSAILAEPVPAGAQPATGHYTLYLGHPTTFKNTVIQRGLAGRVFPQEQMNAVDGGGNRDELCRPITLP